MNLCYQVATPDVAIADSVTAYQGDLNTSLKNLAEIGYDGVEFMTLDPSKLDWEQVKSSLDENNLMVAIVCTGEIFGQLNLSYSHPDKKIRDEAIERSKGIIDFASFLEADINIGRIRGQYNNKITKEQTEEYAIAAFKELSKYAKPKNVRIALETVTIMQTNFINTLADAKDMVERVDEENFGLMMDVFHLNLEEKDIYEAIVKYQPLNFHVHLADNNRRYPGHCGLDFKKIIQTFKDNGYDGNYCTEIYQIPDQHRAAIGAYEHLAPIFKEIYGREI
ncbi:MAG TPA: sugar phosphate isomerase/epimerase [Clostridiaceae bacterium]|nr:sugar phosphate isomerase/epimerase [Clostridiaceae bacterium]